MTVADDAGCLMLFPFDIAADASATVGEPLFHPRASGRESQLLAAGAAEVASLGASTLHIALPVDSPLGPLFASAGFTGGPVMMEMAGPVPAPAPAPPADWVACGQADVDCFARVFYSTLEGSLDFPELPACRDPVLLMRAMGERGAHDDEDFALMRIESGFAAIALFAFEQSSLQVTYMGVVPEHRGKGLGAAVMARAAARARAHGASQISLTVDSRNAPARALYARFGLCEKRAVRVFFRVEKNS
jgi:ribosomal protein S18 acetylase RimI-like enzyme